MAESTSSSETAKNKDSEHKEDNDVIAATIKEGYAALMPTIRASNTLPKGSQWDLFCTSPSFKPIMDSLGNKAQELMNLILNHQGMNRDIRKRDLEEKYELIVEANDKILERVGIHLDELSGIRRNPGQTSADIPVSQVNRASGSWNKNVSQSAAWKEVRVTKEVRSPIVLKSARVTLRPQVKFLDKIDNRSIPFEPRLKDKPNALKPLAILYEELPDEDACYSHPYEFELERFQERIDQLELGRREPREPRPVADTPLLWVATEPQLDDLLSDLEQQTEIAVDLEHHSYRSFQGFTCLIQISTREKDYIIDTLELRHKLHILNKVFTDPKIVKVFHGADSDIPWLQRDFSLYVVNMFDTYQAALLLSLPRLSLAFLLKTFCNVDANKTFQLYDWRTRPLAKEAVKYAREDTHYLLYIYDMLWNKLLDRSKGGNHLLQSAIYRSADTCKKRYWKSIYKQDSYEGMYRGSKKNFDNRQLYALKELHAWRDRTAREEDESIGYVLPNHMLLLIAESLPKEMQGILACCNPIPPLVRQNLVLLHQIILKAREQPLVVRMVSVNMEARVRPTQQSAVNLEGALHCPHDLTHDMDFRDNLPTLLDENYNLGTAAASLLETEPSNRVYGNVEKAEDITTTRMSLPNQIYFMSPFERYKRMLSYLEEEGKKTAEEKEEEIRRDTQNLLDECMRERLKASAAQASPGSTFSGNLANVKQENENPRKRARSEDSRPDESLNTLDVSVKTELGLEETITHSPKKRKTGDEEVSSRLDESVISIKSEDESPLPKRNKKKRKNIPAETVQDVGNVQNEDESEEVSSRLDESIISIKSEDESPLPKRRRRIHQKKKKNNVPAETVNDVGNVQSEDSCSPPKRKKVENDDDIESITSERTGVKKKQFSNKQGFGKKSSESFTPFDYSQVDYKEYQQSQNSQTQRNAPDRFKHKGKKKQQNKMFTFQRQYGGSGGGKKN